MNTVAEGRDEMDKQTAIDLLDNLLGMVEDNHDSDYDTAIKMGIDAIKEKTQLSKEDATKDATLQQDMSGNMSGTQNPLDCISRQAAIDEIDEWIKAFRENGHKESAADACLIQDGIIQLPSAQPEQIARDIATIIENEQDMRVLLKNTERTEKHDLVSRRAAIKTAKNVAYYVDEHGSAGGWLAMLVNWLEILPSAQPENTETHEWIPVTEALPEDIRPVIVTWKNNDPKSYYQYIVGKHFIGVAHFKGGKWYWYSSTTEDFLAEYGRYDGEEFDEAIEVVAWCELPEPYKGGQDEQT